MTTKKVLVWVVVVALGASAKEGPTIEWSDLSVQLVTKKKTRYLVHDMSGRIEPGRLVALMGPSVSVNRCLE